jgi:hypothetical protein
MDTSKPHVHVRRANVWELSIDQRPFSVAPVPPWRYDSLICPSLQAVCLSSLSRLGSLSRRPCRLTPGARLPVQTLTVIDATNVTLGKLTKTVRDTFGRITHIDQNNYPETLGATIILNAGWVFSSVFKVIATFLDPRTREKIQMLGSSKKDLAVLQSFLDLDQIPACVGGNLPYAPTPCKPCGVYAHPRCSAPTPHHHCHHASPYGDAKGCEQIVTLGISGGRSLTRPFRDARRFPSTRL